MSPTRKRNPNDLTLRNLHALKKRLIQLTDRVTLLERIIKDLGARVMEMRLREAVKNAKS